MCPWSCEGGWLTATPYKFCFKVSKDSLGSVNNLKNIYINIYIVLHNMALLQRAKRLTDVRALAEEKPRLHLLPPGYCHGSEWLMGSETRAGDCSVMASELCPWVCCTLYKS